MAWIETHGSAGIRNIPCEVVGFRDRFVLLMPVEKLGGIRPGARVIPGGKLRVPAGYEMLGRVVNGLGNPIDEGPALKKHVKVELDRTAPAPLSRERLLEPLVTGVRALDGLMTCAKGQRLGIFAGSGVGKSVLLGSLARNASSTVNVIALIGERGREVKDFVEGVLGPEGLKKSVVVAATSDESPLVRIKGAFTAMAIAEYFRDQGEHVLLLMDSVTRCAMAQREIGLAIGEPPTTKGYPPSVFGLLAGLLERSGASDLGSITGFFTVLVEGDDMNDPIADSIRAILDGHIKLSRSIAESGRYPAVDVLGSISRIMNDIVEPAHEKQAVLFRSLLAEYQKAENLINVGAYVKGSNPKIDEAIKKINAMQTFLIQPRNETSSFKDTLLRLEDVLK